MGYHIFMARKCQLTTLKNNAYADMMNEWVAQEHIADQKLGEMQDNSDKLGSRYSIYDSEKEAIYDEYKDETDTTKLAERDRKLDDAKEKYNNDIEQYKRDYSIQIQKLTDEETSIEKKIQILETHISEYTQEMSKAEQQEATEIKTCIPNYNGAGGGQG